MPTDNERSTAQEKPAGSSEHQKLGKWTYIRGIVGVVLSALAGGLSLYGQIQPNTLAWSVMWLAITAFILLFTSAATFVREIKAHLSTVQKQLKATTESLARIDKRVAEDIEDRPSSIGLDGFQKVYHHYHLTKNRRHEAIWVYKILNFTDPPRNGKLVARAPIRVELGHEDREPAYRFEGTFDNPDFVVHVRRFVGTPDISVELFPRAASKEPPYYGMKLLTTISGDESVMTMSVLRTAPIEANAPEGPVLNQTAAAALQSDWEKNSGIQRLPLSRRVSMTSAHSKSFLGREHGPLMSSRLDPGSSYKPIPWINF